MGKTIDPTVGLAGVMSCFVHLLPVWLKTWYLIFHRVRIRIRVRVRVMIKVPDSMLRHVVCFGRNIIIGKHNISRSLKGACALRLTPSLLLLLGHSYIWISPGTWFSMQLALTMWHVSEAILDNLALAKLMSHSRGDQQKNSAFGLSKKLLCTELWVNKIMVVLCL